MLGDRLQLGFRGPIIDKAGNPSDNFRKYMQQIESQLANSLTLLGQINANTKIQGRTEGIGTTVQNVDAAGVITAPGVDLSRAYVNKTIDNVNDGASYVRTTPNEKTGAGRGYNALDSNNRLANSFRMTAVNAAYAPTSSTTLSNTGAATLITVAASTQQFGAGTVSYSGGSVDPGAYGTYTIYADDPNYAGGAVTYMFSTNPPDQVAAEGRIVFGVITTTSGSAKTGGGYSGGTTTGGGGGKGYRTT